MATRVFSKALMASEDVQSYVGSCRFYEGTEELTAAPIYDGAFVNIEGLDLDGVYGDDTHDSYDYNVHIAVAPATGKLTREDICVVDLATINEAVVQGNVMKIGGKLVDLTLSAGYNARFRRLMKGDKFWIGEGNFAAVPVIGEYSTVAAGLTTLTASDDEMTEGQINFRILASKALTVGQSVNFKNPGWEQLYLVEVM